VKGLKIGPPQFLTHSLALSALGRDLKSERVYFPILLLFIIPLASTSSLCFILSSFHWLQKLKTLLLCTVLQSVFLSSVNELKEKTNTRIRKKLIRKHYYSFIWPFIFCRPKNLNKGVCHTVSLPFMLKSILRQKKNYGNSITSPCKNIIFKKSSKRNQNPSRYYNSVTYLKFQDKPKYHLSKILI
jgi:hypothetical protein